MTKLVSMKMSKEEREKQYAPMTSEKADTPVYPYGLTVNLDEDALSKLGITDLPEVGGEMTMVATVSVTSANSNIHATGEGTHKHRSIGLQITALALDEGGGKDAATKLYNGDKADK